MSLATSQFPAQVDDDTKSLVTYRFPAHVLPAVQADDTKHAPERLSSCARVGVGWFPANERPSQESLDRRLKELHDRSLATRGDFRLVDADSKTVIEAPLVPSFASKEAGAWLTKTQQEIELHTGQAYKAIFTCDAKRHKDKDKTKPCVANFSFFFLADEMNATNDTGTLLVRLKYKRSEAGDVVVFDQAEWRKTCE